MYRKRTVAGTLALLWFLTAGAPAFATHPVSSDDSNLLCEVRGNTVSLSWNIVFIAPIEGWIINRDGEDIVRLPPEASRYVDEAVRDGEHFYTLIAINFTGEPLRIGFCAAVAGDFGLRCRADELTVRLEWGPILIDVLILNFIVRRDREVIAVVPPNVLELTDVVRNPGTYRYTVHAESSPGHEFVIGACTVRAERPGLVCRVDPPLVHLDWSAVVLPFANPLPPIYHVFRDGALIAVTRETAFTDRPGPGEHHYLVSASFGATDPVPGTTEPDLMLIIGECTVVVPGDRVPPPRELTCVDLDALPEVQLSDVDLLRAHDVLLVWQRPVVYDAVIIARNWQRIARIPGSQFYYVDRDVPPGAYTYQVFGVLGGQVSPPATCMVTIPRPPLAPPHSLTCEFVGERDPSVDPANFPQSFVALRWVNGDLYDAVVVVRDDRALARLAGTATSFRDPNPPPGKHKYGIFGVRGLRRSEAAECEVEVPPGVVPPVEELTCSLIRQDPVPLPQPVDNAAVVDPGAVVGDDADVVPVVGVLLRWTNPIMYDRILIVRNGVLVATLPGTSQSYVDQPPFVQGTVVYSVVGVVGSRRSEAVSCEVEIGPPFVPPPQDFRCEVLIALPTPGVDDPAIGVDPSLRLPVVSLSWVNPIEYLVLVLLRDDGGIGRLPGTTTSYRDVDPPPGHHVYTLWGIDPSGNESRRVFCEVDVPPRVVPPVEDLTCVVVSTSAQGPTAVLRWRNPVDDYTAIWVLRDGEVIAELSGSAMSFNDAGLRPGVYEYAIVAFIGDRRSPPAECRVVVEGPGPRNLLYFSSGMFSTDSASGSAVEVDTGGRITCLASNADPIQGWSFGVCSDPNVLMLAEATIERTTTATLNGGAGPSFLVLNRFHGGVTMAVVIDDADPSDTLPPSTRHSLLRLRYDPGPDAVPGEAYAVRYCATLGDPPVAVLYVVRGFEVRPETLPGFVRFPREQGVRFIRGDVNDDFEADMSDALRILGYLFLGRPAPGCLETADVNGSREINIADPIYLLQWRFSGGPPPPAPFPNCGVAPVLVFGCEEPVCP